MPRSREQAHHQIRTVGQGVFQLRGENRRDNTRAAIGSGLNSGMSGEIAEQSRNERPGYFS